MIVSVNWLSSKAVRDSSHWRVFEGFRIHMSKSVGIKLEEDPNWSIEAEDTILREMENVFVWWSSWEYQIEFRSVKEDVVTNNVVPYFWWSFHVDALVDVNVMTDLRHYWMQTLICFRWRAWGICFHALIMFWVCLLFFYSLNDDYTLLCNNWFVRVAEEDCEYVVCRFSKFSLYMYLCFRLDLIWVTYWSNELFVHTQNDRILKKKKSDTYNSLIE